LNRTKLNLTGACDSIIVDWPRALALEAGSGPLAPREPQEFRQSGMLELEGLHFGLT